jgi:hypothetical protein
MRSDGVVGDEGVILGIDGDLDPDERPMGRRTTRRTWLGFPGSVILVPRDVLRERL